MGRLRNDEKVLNVLGNGNQLKTFIHVDDLVRAITEISIDSQFEVFNLSRSDYSTIKDSVKWLSEELNKSFQVEFGTSNIGWRGDNPRLFLDTSKINAKGWSPRLDNEKAVKDTVNWLWSNQWVYIR